jgi:putative phosphoribosyl transferase
LLAEALSEYRDDETVVVLGVPRGGVIVAAEVARALERPLDIVVASKLGAPGNPEYAVGAIDEDGAIITSQSVSVSTEYLEAAALERRAEIIRRVAVYRAGRPSVDVTGCTAIVVDDGIATGLTVQAVVGFLRRHGAAQIVVCAPVMPPGTKAELERIADDVVALETPRAFSAVGQFYADFTQTSDAEVITALRRAR